MAMSNNARIAKNTMVLYVRMLFSLCVSLYTSRIILQVLGVEDFGIYSVVGGIITLFCFVNGGLINATQRYITFELGVGDKLKLSQVFCSAIQIHALLSIVIFILGESIGLYFLYEKMVIPPERLRAAMVVYQCSIVATIVNLMSVPYNADIVAHEKMSAFAYISIVEVVLKLVIVYLLLVLPGDNLINYAAMMLIVQLSIRIIYGAYCKRHFEETIYHHCVNKQIIKEMASFAGWSFWGNMAGILYTQGINMLLNVFFGPIVNAARGIAVQVQGVVQQFVSNFQMALNPQITKSYAVGDLTNMHKLMFRSAKFSFFLLYLLTLPILFETNFILSLWLSNVPNDTVVFTKLILMISLIYTTANPCVIANQATGKVKKYQSIVGGVLLLVLPFSYVALLFGAPAYSVFIIHFVVESLAQFFRMYLLEGLIKLPVKEYFKNIYAPIAATVLSSLVIPFLLYINMEQGVLRFVCTTAISILSASFGIFTIGLTTNERSLILSQIKKHLFKQ